MQASGAECVARRLMRGEFLLTQVEARTRSPLLKGEVDLLLAMRSIVQCKSGEGLRSLERAAAPHPALRADLSPQGRGARNEGTDAG